VIEHWHFGTVLKAPSHSVCRHFVSRQNKRDSFVDPQSSQMPGTRMKMKKGFLTGDKENGTLKRLHLLPQLRNRADWPILPKACIPQLDFEKARRQQQKTRVENRKVPLFQVCSKSVPSSTTISTTISQPRSRILAARNLCARSSR